MRTKQLRALWDVCAAFSSKAHALLAFPGGGGAAALDAALPPVGSSFRGGGGGGVPAPVLEECAAHAQIALRHMHERKSGAIVAVSSIAAQACQPRGGQAAAAKAGLDALVRVVAKEEGRHGIRANAVSIGLTATEMGADAERAWGEEATKRLLAGAPLGRMGEPEEIARVVRFLASNEASYVTGKVLQVDGGQMIAG